MLAADCGASAELGGAVNGLGGLTMLGGRGDTGAEVTADAEGTRRPGLWVAVGEAVETRLLTWPAWTVSPRIGSNSWPLEAGRGVFGVPWADRWLLLCVGSALFARGDAFVCCCCREPTRSVILGCLDTLMIDCCRFEFGGTDVGASFIFCFFLRGCGGALGSFGFGLGPGFLRSLTVPSGNVTGSRFFLGLGSACACAADVAAGVVVAGAGVALFLDELCCGGGGGCCWDGAETPRDGTSRERCAFAKSDRWGLRSLNELGGDESGSSSSAPDPRPPPFVSIVVGGRELQRTSNLAADGIIP